MATQKDKAISAPGSTEYLLNPEVMTLDKLMRWGDLHFSSIHPT
jgi:hypothetical protein